MNKQTEALKMAIEGYVECLEDMTDWAAYASEYFQDKHDLEGNIQAHKQKIQACKEALEQPAQEPVAWMHYKTFDLIYHDVWEELLDGKNDWYPLYTHPAPPCQECEKLKIDLEGYIKANTELINKEWQGLSDEEAICIWDVIDANPCIGDEIIIFVRAIEQALKEKNHVQ